MCNHHQHSLISFQIFLQPVDHPFIQVVGRLVQQQYIKIPRQHLRQRKLSPLSSRKILHLLLRHFDSKLRRITLHQPVLISIPVQRIRRYRSTLRKMWILRKISNLQPILPDNLPLIRLLLPRNHPQQRRLPGTINPHNTNLIPLLDTKRSILKNNLLPKNLTDMLNINNIHSKLLIHHKISITALSYHPSPT